MSAALVALLGRLVLPAARETWLDLAEQIGIERGFSVEEMLDGVGPNGKGKALRHLWGALTGAGVPAGTIAAIFGVTRDQIQMGVKLAFEAMNPRKGP